MSFYHGVNPHLAWCLNSVLNGKVVVATFNQEKALVIVGAFSVIVQLRRFIVCSTILDTMRHQTLNTVQG